MANHLDEEIAVTTEVMDYHGIERVAAHLPIVWRWAMRRASARPPLATFMDTEANEHAESP